MDQSNPFYESLERAYDKGVTLDILEESLPEEAMVIAREYYSKKKMVPKILRSSVLRYQHQSLR